MTETVTIDELAIADEPARWTAASFAVQDSCCQLGSVRLRLAGPQRNTAGILGWSLRGIASVQLDGLPTSRSESPPPPPPPAHPNGVIAIDHVVVMTPALDRTVAALAPHASPPRPAVQPGRRIATVRRSAGLAIPVALMSAPGE